MMTLVEELQERLQRLVAEGGPHSDPELAQVRAMLTITQIHEDYLASNAGKEPMHPPGWVPPPPPNPLTLEYVMDLLEMEEPPESPLTRSIMREAAEDHIRRYGAEWIYQNRVRLRYELEYLDTM